MQGLVTYRLEQPMQQAFPFTFEDHVIGTAFLYFFESLHISLYGRKSPLRVLA
jgi:hypothetical protein